MLDLIIGNAMKYPHAHTREGMDVTKAISFAANGPTDK